MRNARGVALAVLVLAGLAALLWLGRGGEERAAGPAEVASPSQPRMPAPAPVRRTSAEPAEVAFLLEDDPRGTLRLEGQVLDDAGAAVGGAQVVVDSVPPRSTTSEADGSFFFDQLVGRAYTLVARAPVGAAGPVTAQLTESSDPVVLRLRPAGSVEITVVDARDRRPVAGALVELRDLDSLAQTTDARGIAVFPSVLPTGYRVVASAPGFAPQYDWLRVASATTVAKATLALRPGARVAGRVVDDAGAPVEGARVLFAGASDWSQSADPRRDAVTTEADGQFAFPALPAGSIRLVARHRGHAPGRSALITLDGRTPRDGIEIVLGAGAILRGQVVSAAGKPVGSAMVRVAVATEGFVSFEQPRQAYADEAGNFELAGLPRAKLEAVAQHRSAASEITAVDLRDRAEHTVTLRLDVDDVIAGVVVDSYGEPVEGAQVSVWPDFRRGGTIDGRSWRLRGGQTELADAGGRFEIGGLTPGPYEVRAAPAGSGRGSLWIREGAKAKAGDTDVRIVLPADGAIKGRVQLADGGVPALFTVSIGWGSGMPFSSADGSFELPDVPAKRYLVTVEGPGFASRPLRGIEVKEGQTVDMGTIVVAVGRTVSGRVTADGQPVVGAQVRAGRLLFGDGSSATASRGGPPGAGQTKSAETGDDGSFVIAGMGPGDFTIVAEHDELGRSKAQYFTTPRESVRGVELALEPFGALEGVVTKGGEPAEAIIVNAESVAAPGTAFGVASGPDGAFRFDRLAPDTYKVSAMVGMPFTGMGFHSKTVTVASGQTARVDLAIAGGVATVKLQLVPASGKVTFAFSHLMAGEVAPKNGIELKQVRAQLGDVYSSFGLALGGISTFTDVPAGLYSICAQPFPAEVEGQGEIFDYDARQGHAMPVFCKTIEVVAGQPTVAVSLPVTLPPYVADEGEGEGAGGEGEGGA